MWPLLLDLTREESKRMLRRYELEAYSGVITAFRAQGDLTREKKKLLQELQNTLSISTERHRAEVRRAVNDEKLSTVADNMVGSPNTNGEWRIEGRRLVPLMPRLVPQTAFTMTANQMANCQAEKNASMPKPSMTGNKDVIAGSMATTPTAGSTMTATTVAQTPGPASPGSSVLVLAGGMSIHIKDEEDVTVNRRRKRSHSAEASQSAVGTSGSLPLPNPRLSQTVVSSNVQGISPMKITKSQTSLTTSHPQKVILVSSSGPNVMQKSVSVVRTTIGAATNTTSSINPKTSIIYPNISSSSSANGNLGNIVTLATSSKCMTTASVGTNCSSPVAQHIGTSTTALLTPTVSMSKPRAKTLARHLLPQASQQHKPGLVLPMGLQMSQSSTGLQNIHIKTLSKPAIQVKQDGGMKIITQTIPSAIGAGGSNILPKLPSQLSSSSGTPIVVVSASSETSTPATVTMLSRPAASSASSSMGSKILNITTQGGKVIATTNKSSNVVTVNPKTLHLTAVKTAAGMTGGKPNVIVVQKTQGKKSGPGNTVMVSKPLGTPFEKELVSFIQKHDPQKLLTAKTLDNKVIVTSHGFSPLKQRRKSDLEGKTSLLAELIQAAGIVPETRTSSCISASDTPVIVEELPSTSTSHTGVDGSPRVLCKESSQTLPGNEWFEYDIGDERGQTFKLNSADRVSIVERRTPTRSSNVDLGTTCTTEQVPQDQFYTIQQAMSLINQAPVEKTVTMGSSSGNMDPKVQSADSSSSPIVVKLMLKEGLKEGTKAEGVTADIDQGALDPQTGMFSSDCSLSQSERAISYVAPLPSNAQSMDLLSTSLAQAQIDLDPYQFMEDDPEMAAPAQPQSRETAAQPVTSPQPALVGILNVSRDRARETPTESTGAEAVRPEEAVSRSSDSYDQLSSSPALHNTEQPASASFIPLQQLGKKHTTGPSINLVNKSYTGVSPVKGASVTVSMVPPEVVEAGALKLEELTSQRMQVEEEVVDFTLSLSPSPDKPHEEEEDTALLGERHTVGSSAADCQGELAGSQTSSEHSSLPSSEPGNVSDGGLSTDSNQQARLSKRRRKLPTAYEDKSAPAFSHASMGGWVRAALGLLNKVAKVRGSNKEKNDFDAASWFLYPVDPEDAPDYFTIIKNPMDFSTIKKKLENVDYTDFEEFHADMLMVCDNCNLYNPPGHMARLDCQEVFTFYEHEYHKLLEKWQKSHISSPVAKKIKLDKSPGKAS